MQLLMFDHNDFSSNPFSAHLNATAFLTVREAEETTLYSKCAELFIWYEQRVGRIGLMLMM